MQSRKLEHAEFDSYKSIRAHFATADIQGGLSRVRLSANWMAALNHPSEGASLYEAV